jgi:hypothetical protein
MGREKKIGQCRLCLEEKKLGKAHIIPNFFFKQIRRENKNELYSFDAIEATKGNDSIEKENSSEYDSGILCTDCDNWLNEQFESYAANLIFNGFPYPPSREPQDFRTPEGVEFTRFYHIDYKKYKLFLLSILWRASVSSRPFFSSVDLGPHEEVIRTMIREQNAGEIFEYPILTLNYQRADRGLSALVGQPLRKRINGMTAYTFIICGSLITYQISNRSYHADKLFLQSTVKPNGEMDWIHVQGSVMDFLSRVIGVHRSKR